MSKEDWEQEWAQLMAWAEKHNYLKPFERGTRINIPDGPYREWLDYLIHHQRGIPAFVFGVGHAGEKYVKYKKRPAQEAPPPPPPKPAGPSKATQTAYAQRTNKLKRESGIEISNAKKMTEYLETQYTNVGTRRNYFSALAFETKGTPAGEHYRQEVLKLKS